MRQVYSIFYKLSTNWYFLILHTCKGNSFHKVFLPNQIEYNTGHKRHTSCTHNGRPVWFQWSFELWKSDCNRKLIGSIDINHLLKKVIPNLNKKQKRYNKHCWFYGRKNNIKQNPKLYIKNCLFFIFILCHYEYDRNFLKGK